MEQSPRNARGFKCEEQGAFSISKVTTCAMMTTMMPNNTCVKEAKFLLKIPTDTTAPVSPPPRLEVLIVVVVVAAPTESDE